MGRVRLPATISGGSIPGPQVAVCSILHSIEKTGENRDSLNCALVCETSEPAPTLFEHMPCRSAFVLACLTCQRKLENRAVQQSPFCGGFTSPPSVPGRESWGE